MRRVLGQMATAGVIGGLGDAAVQRYEKPSMSMEQFDWSRWWRLVAYRVPHAPIADAAWRSFDRAASRMHLRPPVSVAFKVAADQILLNTTFTAIFFMQQSWLEGRSFETAMARLQLGWWPTVLAGCQYGAVVHTITFGVIPVAHRIAWNSTCAIFWAAYLSHANDVLRLRQQHEQLELVDGGNAERDVDQGIAETRRWSDVASR